MRMTAWGSEKEIQSRVLTEGLCFTDLWNATFLAAPVGMKPRLTRALFLDLSSFICLFLQQQQWI